MTTKPAETDDPFAREADPYGGDVQLPRRALAKLAALPVLAVPLVSACAHLPLGCKPAAWDERGCQHRFCRYYRAP